MSGSPQAFSFNVASISGAGAVTVERGGTVVKKRCSFSTPTDLVTTHSTLTGKHLATYIGTGPRPSRAP